MDCWQHSDEMIMYVLHAEERQIDGHGRFSLLSSSSVQFDWLSSDALQSSPCTHPVNLNTYLTYTWRDGWCIKGLPWQETENGDHHLKKNHMMSDSDLTNQFEGKKLEIARFQGHLKDCCICWTWTTNPSIHCQKISQQLFYNLSHFF